MHFASLWFPFLTCVSFLRLLCNKLLQTWCLKQQKLNLTVLEATSLQSISLGWNQGVDGAMLPLDLLKRIVPCLFQLLVATSIPGLVATSLPSPIFHGHIAFSSSALCLISLCLPLMRIHEIAFRAHSDNPKKVKFTGTRERHMKVFWGDYYSAYYKLGYY